MKITARTGILLPVSSSPTLLAKRYRLMRLLGDGGMGRVWLAHDVKLDRKVAVKEVIPPKGFTEREREEIRLRTLREARTAASLAHPNVVRVFDTMNIDEQPWIVMEYVPSRSLQEVIDVDGRLSPRRVAEIGLSVLAALRAAHKAGVLHRDVKPGNVLLANDGRVVLTDFGLATFDFDGDSQVTRTGVILGSPQYISPERATTGASQPESDLWSFGATLYAALEGRAPYARPNTLATLTALVTEDPDPSPHAGPLQPVLDALLRKDPAQRPSAAMIERRLRRILQEIRQNPQESTLGDDATVKLTTTITGSESGIAHAPTVSLIRPSANNPDSRSLSTERTKKIVKTSLPRKPVTSPSAPRRITREIATNQLPENLGTTPWYGSRFVLYIIIVIITLILVAIIAEAASSERKSSTTSSSPTSPSAVSSPPTTVSTTSSRVSPPPSPTSSPTPSPSLSVSDPGLILPSGWISYQDPTGFTLAVPGTWSRSQEGSIVYFREPGGERVLGIDQTNDPRPDPVADWQEQEKSRSVSLKNYQRVKIVAVNYFLACADWEYTYDNSYGTRLHVLDRGFVTAKNHAYAIFWLTTENQWHSTPDFFPVFANSFRPAP